MLNHSLIDQESIFPQMSVSCLRCMSVTCHCDRQLRDRKWEGFSQLRLSEGLGHAWLVVVPVVTQSVMEEGRGVIQLLILW